MTRVLLDTCPSRRLQIVQFLLNFDVQVSVSELYSQFPMIPYMGMRQLLDDLRLLQLVEIEKVCTEKFVILSEKFREMLQLARVPSQS